MNVEVLNPGEFASARVTLAAGERFVSESGAMVRMSDGVDVDVTTRSKGKGGVLQGIKRLIGGDSFFMSTYSASQPVEIVLAPTLPGDVSVLQLDGRQTWVCAGASYLASGPDVGIETRFQGVKGMFSGESLFFVEATGSGPLLVNAFGRIQEATVDGELVVDTGHVVAYESTLNYSITKAGGSWIQSFLAGEGLVMKFSGRGRILVQSHNPKEFGTAIGPKLPPRRA